MKAIPASVSMTVLGNGRLHRAVVALPDAMGERDRGYQERVVFFEALRTADAAVHLERLPLPGAPIPRAGVRTARSRIWAS